MRNYYELTDEQVVILLNILNVTGFTDLRDQLKQQFEKREDYMHAVWQVDDILETEKQKYNDPKLTIEDARNILADMDRRHDASIGINWDVIEFWVQEYRSHKHDDD